MVEPFGESGHGPIKTPSGSTEWLTYLFLPVFCSWPTITQLSRGTTAIQCGLLDALVCFALYPFFFNPFLVRTSPSAISTLD